MKLQNQSLKYLSISIFLIISLWAPIFYYIIQDEIHDSLDASLSNQKIQIIRQKTLDTSREQILRMEGNYFIREVSKNEAFAVFDSYTDTSIYVPANKEQEPMRLLSTAFQAGDHFYTLKVWSSVVEQDDLITDLFWAMVWLYVVLIVSVIIINNFALKRLWRPFYQILGQLKAYRIEKNEPLAALKTRTAEFAALKKAADSLTEHAREVFNSQKQFTENAAHELQTPLAVLTNKIELLLEKGDLDEHTAAELTAILSIIHQLKQLNKSLLLLSKIENKQFIENKKISLGQLCHEVLENLEPYATYKNVQVSFQQKQAVDIDMNSILAHVLVSNLIKNAIFHNKESGQVSITLTANRLTIANSGVKSPLDSEAIFKRFFKGSTSHRSTGLGLSIVAAIVKVYQLTIRYYYADEMHHFEVDFNNPGRSPG